MSDQIRLAQKTFIEVEDEFINAINSKADKIGNFTSFNIDNNDELLYNEWKPIQSLGRTVYEFLKNHHNNNFQSFLKEVNDYVVLEFAYDITTIEQMVDDLFYTSVEYDCIGLDDVNTVLLK